VGITRQLSRNRISHFVFFVAPLTKQSLRYIVIYLVHSPFLEGFVDVHLTSEERETPEMFSGEREHDPVSIDGDPPTSSKGQEFEKQCAAKSQEAQQNIIWIASYSKPRNTWVRVFVNNLLRELAKARPAVQSLISKKQKGLSLTKTHLCFGADHDVPTINLSVTLAAIYIVRNPMDVAISYAHHCSRPVDAIIADMARPGFRTPPTENHVGELPGSWSQHVASWMGIASPPVHIIHYEDLLGFPAALPAALQCLWAFARRKYNSEARRAVLQVGHSWSMEKSSVAGAGPARFGGSCTDNAEGKVFAAECWLQSSQRCAPMKYRSVGASKSWRVKC
jgi:hypothetical protein